MHTYVRVGTATFTVDPIRTYVQYVPLEYRWTYVRRRRGRGRGRGRRRRRRRRRRCRRRRTR